MSAKFPIGCPNCREPLTLNKAVAGTNTSCPSCGYTFVVDDLATVTLTLRLPKRIDRFELLELVGEGAFGVVWKARDSELNRIVALKVPRSSQVDPKQSEAFLREARACAKLRHPNIIPVHEICHDESQLFIVCDFIDGPSLSRWMDRERPSFTAAARLVRSLALALHHAHENGIVHRDVKPSNILLDRDGTPYIGDFGLARRVEDVVTVTLEGQIIGTPAYMSPEQARGEGCYADARSDVYSLGVVLYELLSGERPFRGSFTMILQQVMHDDPPSLRHLNHRIPRDLEVICLKCLEKEPRRRYASAGQMASDMERFLSGESIDARPVHTAEKVWRWYRRNSNAATIIAGALTIANSLVLIGWGWFGIAVVILQLHPTANRWQAALELLVIIVLVYLPCLAVGLRTLNGGVVALWAGTIISFASLVNAIGMIAGTSPMLSLQALQEARSSTYTRWQLSSLLMFIIAGVLIAHLIALASRIGERRQRLEDRET